MSGYRNLHREQVLFGEKECAAAAAIWSLCTTPLFSDMTPTSSTSSSSSSSSTTLSVSPHWRVWMACSDSTIRGYRVFEKNAETETTTTTKTSTPPISATAATTVEKKDDDAKEDEEEDEEKEPSSPVRVEEELSASAVQLQYTHCLSLSASASNDDDVGNSNSSSSSSSSSVGCTALSSICVPQAQANNGVRLLLVLAAMDLVGTLHVWTVPIVDDSTKEDASVRLQHKPSEPENVQSSAVTVEVPNATGTTALFVPPPLPGTAATTSDSSTAALDSVVLVAVGCLDGTIALVSTGISLLLLQDGGDESAAAAAAFPAGNIVQVWGDHSSDSSEEEERGDLAVPMAMTWQPKRKAATTTKHDETSRTLAVGRFDGHVDVYTTTSSSSISEVPSCISRLDTLCGSPVRAVTYTTDGHLLIAGNDQGNLCLWDCSRCSKNGRPPPVLRHHFYQAHHATWILQATALDERSFLTLGADCRVHVWNVGQMDHAHPVHTFTSSFFSSTDTDTTTTTSTAPLANKNKKSAQQKTNDESSKIDADEGGEDEEKKETTLPPLAQPQPMLWSMARGPPSTARFITGSDHGWLQIYSLE